MFADNDIKKVFTHFEIPFRSAGFSGGVDDLIEEWHDLIEYTVKYLKPATTDYHKCWYKIFNCSMSKNWELPLLIVCLLFTLSVSNAFVERLLFSLMKRVKTSVRSSMGNLMLNCVIRICQEGPPLDKFEGTSALKKFMETKDRRPNQSAKENVIETLVDVPFNDDDENLFPFLRKPAILTLNLMRSSYMRSKTPAGNGISTRVKKIG